MKSFKALSRAFGLLAVLAAMFSGTASGDEIVSLTAPTVCRSPNGNGGDWCQSNGTPFNLTSFTTQNLTLTGSSAFFAITNNTGKEVTSFTIDFIGSALNGAISCGGGGSGIQGSGPGSSSTTTCSVSSISGGAAITWNNLAWGTGQTFDFQIASFSNGSTGVFSSVPEPGTFSLLVIGMIGLVALGRRKFAAAK